MNELRCKACRHLLLKISPEASGYLEVKCVRHKCGKINKIKLPLACAERAPLDIPAHICDRAQ